MLALFILDMGLAYSVLNGHFEPVYLLQASKSYGKEHCLLNKFGFKRNIGVRS